MRVFLAVMFAALVATTQASARDKDKPGFGYCPAGTCNLKGVESGSTNDVSQKCSAKNCHPQNNSKRSSARAWAFDFTIRYRVSQRR